MSHTQFLLGELQHCILFIEVLAVVDAQVTDAFLQLFDLVLHLLWQV